MRDDDVLWGWRSGRLWLWSGVFWLTIAMVEGLPPILYDLEPAWIRMAAMFMVRWCATPVAFECVRRCESLRGTRYGVALVLCSLVLGFGAAAVSMLLGAFQGQRWDGWALVLVGFFGSVWLGMSVVLLAAAVQNYRLALARRRDLDTAQLRALRAQLQPHFLFNTLHTIGVTAKQDGAAAARMTTLLGDLLRQTLQERERSVVPLAQELELLQPYLQLQQLRFGDRLQITVDVPTDVLGAEVPDLVLQPLVENALRHGIERMPGAGAVVIRARRAGPFLRLQVIDDGAGLDADAHDGTGLGATRARLQAMFGDAADLELAPAGVRGTTVTLRLPFRERKEAA